jgi:glycosyltransferase involved in cell wall biosynthesis
MIRDASPGLPPVTVVVPTRGRPELVRCAVLSVVGQRYDGQIDCIVVHDQEVAEESLSALSRPMRNVRVIVNDGHPGLAASRNAGLRRATTEFVASCDDDDTWLPGKLRLQMGRLLANPDLLVVGAGIRLLMPHGRVVEWLGSADLVTTTDLLRSRCKELHSSTLVMRRSAFELAGTYDENLPHSYAEDFEWLLRVSRHGAIGVVREPLADIKKDGPSWFRGRCEAVAEALDYVLAVHPEIAASRRGHARILGQIAFAKAGMGDRRAALTLSWQSLGRWPFTPHAALAVFVSVCRVNPAVFLRPARLVGRGLA